MVIFSFLLNFTFNNSFWLYLCASLSIIYFLGAEAMEWRIINYDKFCHFISCIFYLGCQLPRLLLVFYCFLEHSFCSWASCLVTLLRTPSSYLPLCMLCHNQWSILLVCSLEIQFYIFSLL